MLTNQPQAPKHVVDSDAYSHISFVRTLQDMFQARRSGRRLVVHEPLEVHAERSSRATSCCLPEYAGSADPHFDAVRPMNHAYVIPADYVQKNGFPTSADKQVGPDATQINLWAEALTVTEAGDRTQLACAAPPHRRREPCSESWCLLLSSGVAAAWSGLAHAQRRLRAAPTGLSPAARVGKRVVLRPIAFRVRANSPAPPVTTPRMHMDRPTTLAVQPGGPTLATAARGRCRPCAISEYTPPYSDLLDNPDGISKPGPGGGLTHDGRAPTLADQARIPLLAANEMANRDAAEVVAKIRRVAVCARVQERSARAAFSQTRHGRFARAGRAAGVPARGRQLSSL